MIPTLKARITLWNVLVIASALSLFAVLLYVWLSRTLYSHHEGDLADEARQVVRTLSSSAEPLAALTLLDRTDAAAPLLMVRDAHGQMLFRSNRLVEIEPGIGEHEVLTHAAASGVTADQYFTVQLGRGPVRFACLPLADGTYLQLGRPLGDIDALLRVLILASSVLVPVVILLTSFGGFLIATRALRPIDDIAASLESIQARDLARRVDPHAPDVEVMRLTSSINRLLDRLQTSFTAMKEFTADVSHQLQTPLTVMRSTIDSAQDAPPEDLQRVISEVGHEISALTATLQDLRDFALAEADSSGQRSAPVDGTAVFEEAADLIRALAEAHQISCEVSIAGGLRVWGNSVRLRQIILNIGENAVQSTPPEGRIGIEAKYEATDVVITISDTGRGIGAEVLPCVFDRHVQARAPGSPAGSGLGLAITKRIVEAHGGSVSIHSTVGAGTTAIVKLPRATLDRAEV